MYSWDSFLFLRISVAQSSSSMRDITSCLNPLLIAVASWFLGFGLYIGTRASLGWQRHERKPLLGLGAVLVVGTLYVGLLDTSQCRYYRHSDGYAVHLFSGLWILLVAPWSFLSAPRWTRLVGCVLALSCVLVGHMVIHVPVYEWFWGAPHAPWQTGLARLHGTAGSLLMAIGCFRLAAEVDERVRPAYATVLFCTGLVLVATSLPVVKWLFAP